MEPQSELMAARSGLPPISHHSPHRGIDAHVHGAWTAIRWRQIGRYLRGEPLENVVIGDYQTPSTPRPRNNFNQANVFRFLTRHFLKPTI
jgi:hypothetical protein